MWVDGYGYGYVYLFIETVLRGFMIRGGSGVLMGEKYDG